MKWIDVAAGGVRNDSPIGTMHLNRRAKATELLWLSRAVDASGLSLDEIVGISGAGSFAYIETAPTRVTVPDA